MSNRNAIIDGLQKCAAIHQGFICESCEYTAGDCAVDDAIAMLKAQEPVEPIRHYVPDGKRSSVAWQCGGCLIDIGYGVNYCYNCGMPVKWE